MNSKITGIDWAINMRQQHMTELRKRFDGIFFLSITTETGIIEE